MARVARDPETSLLLDLGAAPEEAPRGELSAAAAIELWKAALGAEELVRMPGPGDMVMPEG